MAAPSSSAGPARRDHGPSAAPRWQVWAALWVVYLVWGSTYLAIRVVVRTAPPLLAAGARFLVAGALMASALAALGRASSLRARRDEVLTAALVGVLLCLGGNGLVTIAEQSVPSGLTALLIACVPLFVVVLRRLGGERPQSLTVLGVVLGVVGVGVLLLPSTTPSGARPLHLALLVAAPALWSAGSYLSTRRPMPPQALAATAIEMLAGGAACLVLGLVRGEAAHWAPSHVSGESALAWVYLLVAGSLLAFTAYVWLLGVAPVSLVATYAFVNPVVAVVLGALILSERVTAGSVVGGGIIVAAVAVVVVSQGRETRRSRIAEAEDAEVPCAAG